MSVSVLIPVLAALAGAAIGGLVAELRQGLQISRDNRKIRNRVLYTQLDVWHTVSWADPEVLLSAAPKIMAGALGIPEADIQSAFKEYPAVEGLWRQVLPQSIPTDLERRYQNAVDSLADVNPLLAYQLSGRPELNTFSKAWLSRIDAFTTEIQASEQDRRTLAAFSPPLDRELRARLLETLEDDIRDVARAISWLRRRQVSKTIERGKMGATGIADRELEKVIQRLFVSAGVRPSDMITPTNAATPTGTRQTSD